MNELAVRAAWVADQVTTNRPRLLTIAGTIAAIGIAAWGYFYFQNRAADRATAMLGAAMQIAQSRFAPASSVPGALQAPGTYPTEAARGEATAEALRKVID